MSIPLPSPEAAHPGAVCSSCQSVLDDSYWERAGSVVCGRCKTVEEAAAAEAPVGTRAGRFSRALLLGGGAGLIGAAAYATFIVVTEMNWALISIAVGLAVGAGVRRGSRGRGGRRYQVLAAVVAYLAIGAAHIPLAMDAIRQGVAAKVMEGAGNRELARIEGDSARIEAAPFAPSMAAAPAAESPITGPAVAIALVIGFVGALLLALTLPLMTGLGDLPVSLISLAITVFGVMQAWKMNARIEPAPFTGPYRLGDASGGPAAPAPSA